MKLYKRTLINIIFQAESPSSGKFTAIGIYLLACLFFVVAGFVEFAIVLQLQRYYNQAKKTNSPIKEKLSIKENGITNSEEKCQMKELGKESELLMNLDGCKLRLNKQNNICRKRRMSTEDFKDYKENVIGENVACRATFDARKIDILAFGIVSILFVIFNVVYCAIFYID